MEKTLKIIASTDKYEDSNDESDFKNYKFGSSNSKNKQQISIDE